MTITAAPARLGIGSGALACAFVGASVPVSGLLVDYPLFAGQAVRYALGGLLLVAWAAALRVRIRPPAWRDMPALLAVVAIGMLGFNACLLAAQRSADPGLVAAVLGGSPLVIAMIAPMLTRSRPAVRALAGAGLAVVGVVILSGGGSWHGPGLFLAILTMLGEASFTLFAVGPVQRLGGFSVALWCHAIAVVCGAALAVSLDGVLRAPTATESAAIGAVAVLTVVAFCLWYRCVELLGAGRAAVLIGAMPVSGLAVSVALGAQPLTAAAVLGAVVVAMGCVFGLKA
ncbi:Permease of the drug/metabolite transporter (DMT) superfamily [Alloactinosynnema sp. L-07]|uniref:DMT family transporter n=1 Tax=Alloactinosynnema sp. L-07 TaxID=1653480 RepID=UPI00065F08C9|nr:DMT family transporter [Alloactinosynnema sp. L-07]CRK61611.1 Permease of the drug/metabolite transporter (DMT) superfamily [Alloactinosynnema sp. L-07]